MNRLIKLIMILKNINPWKTILFNFHYFKPKIAIRMPVFIYWRSVLQNMKGQIQIQGKIKTGMLHFGGNGLLIKDKQYSRTIWNNFGTFIIMGGRNHIGRGSKIVIGKNARLIFGENIMITGNSEIVCSKEISFGANCLLSWDILIMDDDFHNIIDNKGEIINSPRPISIGEHCWIGCRSTILKGVSIANNNIIASNSVISRNIKETNCILGGVGKTLDVLKRDVSWER